MKKTIIIKVTFFALSLISCRKDYVCVCTEKATGEKNYGDHFKAGPILKKTAEESCKSNNEVFKNELENCNLE